MTLPPRYFLYARKSSENEDRQVASIPSQIDELKKLAQKYNLKVIDVLTEEKSAKAPGRPIFSQMVADIHKGVADGIICWKLDRLARNPIDGGTISWMLQQALIKHIQTFQKSYYPQDNVLMMSLEFGMANQYIIDLSVNAKRGHRNKIQNGWYPHRPPLGYLNNKYQQPDLPPIFRDPDSFPALKQLWETLLQKKCSLEKLHVVAKEMNLKTQDGKIISRPAFFRLFRNPFYYGSFLWLGEIYPGKHEPMISESDFHLAQLIIDNRSRPRAKFHSFAYTGLIRCGECGASITAEEKFKRQKNGNFHHYTYYRCTKRINPKCSQMPVRKEILEAEIMKVLENIRIPPSFHKWALKYLKEEQEKEVVDREEVIFSQQRQLEGNRRKLDNLINMRINEEISVEEYERKKKELMQEKAKLEALLVDSNDRVKSWMNKAEELFSFAETAKKRFETGSLNEKREILACLGSNLTLMNRTLQIDVEKSLSILQNLSPEVQTLHNRLEPLQTVENEEVYEEYYAKNVKWRGGL